METGMGHRKWCIPDMYMKEAGDMPTPSHESITILNTGDEDAAVEMDLIFDNGAKPERLEGILAPAHGAVHIHMHRLERWQIQVPRSVCYSAMITSSRKVVAEYARFNWIDGAVQSFAVIPYGED